jgi:cyclic pyranopterin phosphate synthase
VTTPRDRHGRPLRSLRVSVTDRCNLRCAYCMPEEEYTWLPRTDLLSYEEIRRLAGVFCGVGVERVRLTGGEPLLRRDLEVLVGMLAGEPRVRDLSLTTNGVLLAERAAALRAAGLHRVTVSLDTLRADRFEALTRRREHGRVLAGIRAAARAGFRAVKINAVVVRGVNDDEIGDLLAFGRDEGAEVRFIEYMDVGGATRWSIDRVVTRREILEKIAASHGRARPLPQEQVVPADRFRLPDGTTFGVISSTSAPFCGACDRSRLTADGVWLLCLYARQGIDLRGPLRAGSSDAAIAASLIEAWAGRTDRGAEDRLAAAGRGVLVPREALRHDPHLEMHTRGG